jgi:hypothetical protein
MRAHGNANATGAQLHYLGAAFAFEDPTSGRYRDADQRGPLGERHNAIIVAVELRLLALALPAQSLLWGHLEKLPHGNRAARRAFGAARLRSLPGAGNPKLSTHRARQKIGVLKPILC